MKAILFTTGYSNDSEMGFPTKELFKKHFRENIRKDTKGFLVNNVILHEDTWHVSAKTTKKALTEIFARIEEDSSCQSVDMEEIKEAVNIIWAQS